MFKIPLKYRITGALFSTAALVLVIVLSQVLSQYFEGSRGQIYQQEQVTLDLLGEFARTTLLTADYDSFQPQLERLARLPGVTGVVLADDRGIVVAASQASWVGQSWPFQEPDQGEWQQLSLENAAGSLGMLAARFSDEALMALHQQVGRLALIWSLGGLLLISIGSLMAGHLLTRRLEQVSLAASQVAAGDLSARANVEGQDEVADLGRVFDGMVDTIRHERACLEEREQYLSMTLDSIGDGVIATDARGYISRMNPVAEGLTGWKNEDARGQHLTRVFKIINADSRQSVADPVEKVLASGQIVGLANHTILISKDGNEFQIADSAAPIKDKQNHIQGVILVFRDVSQQYQTEEALRRSQKMDAIGQLSGGVAHDFNNQLGIIIGYLDFLKAHLAEEQRPLAWVDAASKATLRCMDLTRQLLAFSRRQVKETSTISLNHGLREMETMISRSLTPAVEVEYSLEDKLWLTDVNPGEFQDAVLNLVINARDAMSAGGKLMIETANKQLDDDYVALHPDSKAGDYVQLLVSDTGSGMDRQTREHIFEPFFTTKPKDKGTGLGMAMVYGFVKRYGGFINIYSEPGIGTTIAIYLPRSAARESSRDTETLPAEVAGGQESILIVDDEKSLLQLAEKYLSDLGYHTYCAENAIQALDILQTEKIDLLFSDVVMPGGMNGYELARQACLQQDSLKVLLTSGFTEKTMAQNGQETLARDILNKPYRRNELASRIRMVLDESDPPPASLEACHVMVVDDDEDMQLLFKMKLDKLGCKVTLADNGSKAINIYQKLQEQGKPVDIVILDLNLADGMGGLGVREKIHAMDPAAKIIVASGNTEGPEMTDFQSYGFQGALEKNFDLQKIRQLLSMVLLQKC